jgi:hypothetical protein
MNVLKLITLTFILAFAKPVLSQTVTSNAENNDDKYFITEVEVKGKTAYTEIVINATPKKVREEFLKLTEWPTWNSVIVKIEVLSGDINDISTKPRIDALFHVDTTKAPQPAPMKLWLTANNEQVFIWEVKNGLLLKAKHVYLFLPEDGGNTTRLVHYERMTGFLSLFFSKKLRGNMENRYGLMNTELKQLCEK